MNRCWRWPNSMKPVSKQKNIWGENVEPHICIYHIHHVPEHSNYLRNKIHLWCTLIFQGSHFIFTFLNQSVSHALLVSASKLEKLNHIFSHKESKFEHGKCFSKSPNIIWMLMCVKCHEKRNKIDNEIEWIHSCGLVVSVSLSPFFHAFNDKWMRVS